MKTISKQLVWQKIHSSIVEQNILTGNRLPMESWNCRTNDMISDMMTKGLSDEQFEKVRPMAEMAPMIEHPESSEKEC